jgi:hypothetical protein
MGVTITLRSKQRSINVELQHLDDCSMNSKKIDMLNAMYEAENKISNYYDVNIEVIDLDFNKDIWILKNKLINRIVVFDFYFLDSLLKKDMITYNHEIKHAIKCWTAEILSCKALDTVRAFVYDLYSAIYATKAFDKDFLEIFIELLESQTIYRRTSKGEFEKTIIGKYSIVAFNQHILSFLTFYDMNKYVDYINAIMKINNRIKVEINSRELPSLNDVMKFKFLIEDWYSNISTGNNEHDEIEYIRFFSVYFWWELTSIIPMRPTEFCMIKRNCLSKQDEKYYISFPRLKFHRKGERRYKNHNDTLPIPQNLYSQIENYKRLTEKYGESKYLIHYGAFLDINKNIFGQDSNNGVISIRKVGRLIFKTNLGDFIYGDSEHFVINHLAQTIAKFYRDIIHKRYNVNLLKIPGGYKKILQKVNLLSDEAKDSINSMLSPGDLRHLAIINMMLQGYNPVEIKRLAGHVDIKTQMSYLNHMSFWVDSEIHQLATQFSKFNYHIKGITQQESNKYLDIYNPLSVNMLKKLERYSCYLFTDEIYIVENQKLEIGFCKDETMTCPTFNWKHKGCYFCRHWAITANELAEKRDTILNDINIIYDELGGKVNFLKSLFRFHWNNSSITENEANKEIKIISQDINSGITNIAKLIGMLGVEIYE